MLKNAVSLMAVLTIVIGIGVPPMNAQNNTQGKLMARRTAIISIYHQTNGKSFQLKSENWNDHQYIIKGEVQ